MPDYRVEVGTLHVRGSWLVRGVSMTCLPNNGPNTDEAENMIARRNYKIYWVPIHCCNAAKTIVGAWFGN